MSYKPLSDEELHMMALSPERWSASFPDLIEQGRRANRLAGFVEHAIEIGYFAEGGSTDRLLKDALAAYRGNK